MDTPSEVPTITVLNPDGRRLSPCSRKRADQMVQRHAARWLGLTTIQLAQSKEDKRRIRRMVLDRDSWKCYLCGCALTEETATIDHKVPKVRGGSDTPENLAAACSNCNQDKGFLTFAEFQAMVEVKE